ncbi:MAG TPA: type II toxin-antitoxin system RelE/ParE family toxin [Planctomycetota bacterium]|nr:type II toxin-antitoxin system RelE/ParE family toxin [Planctomycetota bacterium]
MARFHLSARAGDGLLRILDSVESSHGSVVAERVLSRLASAFQILAERPQIGHRRQDLTADPDVRFWSVSPTLIAYRRADAGGIEVLAVERGEWDWTGFADRDPD